MSDQEQDFQEEVELGVRPWGAPDCNRFASPASPEFSIMCAELMLAELTTLMRAELNDVPGSDIIEHKLYAKSLISHVPVLDLASMTKGKVSKRHAAATDDLSNIDPKMDLPLKIRYQGEANTLEAVPVPTTPQCNMQSGVGAGGQH